MICSFILKVKVLLNSPDGIKQRGQKKKEKLLLLLFWVGVN